MTTRHGKRGAAPRAAAPPSTSGWRTWLDPREPVLVPLVAALFARLYWASLLEYAAEDAYITFRYAENWARGLGPVYNPGERVMGYSSPLWTAWLALGALFTGSAFWWARLWGVVFDLAALALGAVVLRREAGRASGWAFGIFYALFPTFAAFAVLGMETSLFVLLLVAAAWAAGARHASGGVWLGLLGLTRPEALVSAAIVALGATWRQRLVGAAIVASGAVAVALYYGSVVPSSVTGKALTYGTEGLAGAWTWLSGFVPALVASWPKVVEMQHLVVLSLVFTPAAVAAALPLWNRPGAARLVAAGGLVVLAGYAGLGVPFFAWYLVVPLAAWGWLAAAGLPAISRHPALWAALGLFVLVEVVPLRHLYGGRARVEQEFRVTGLRLRDLSGGRGTAFLEPIGHIGYVSGLRVLDEVGLVSPAVRQHRARGDGWYYDVVRVAAPEYLVVRPGQLEGNRAWAGRHAPFRSLAERDSVLAWYEPDPAAADSPPMWILRRRAAPGAVP